MSRKARTHRLIELGGLVEISALPVSTDDDRAVLLGALLEAKRKLEEDPTIADVWRNSGELAFRARARQKRDAAEQRRSERERLVASSA